MKDQPLITVIIPIYNVEQYLERCVDSIIGQTYRNLEIILVDDGSTDCSGNMCDKYVLQDRRIKVIHKENGGLSDARNAALPIVGGAYICFVDSDDWVSPYYIEHLYNAVITDESDMAAACYEEVFEPDLRATSPSDGLTGYECLDATRYLERMFYQKGSDTYVTVKLYKKEIISDLRFPIGKLYEDIPIAYETATRCRKVAIITNRDYYYLQRANAIQNKPFNNRKMDSITHFQDVMHAVQDDHPELLPAVKCRYLSVVFNILFQIRDKEHEDTRAYLWDEVMKYRKGVLLDKSARTKARLAALLSYLGYPIIYKIYNRSQWRANYHS